MVREADSWISQTRKGVVELVVLQMLDRERMYGSQLVESLASHQELAVSPGTIYPLLSRLKKAGAIDSMWEESPVGPPRKYYRLTDSGRRELAEMTRAWTSVSGAVNEIIGRKR